MVPDFRRDDVWTPAFAGVTLQETFYESIIFDDLVKSRQDDGFVKSSRCKARKN